MYQFNFDSLFADPAVGSYFARELEQIRENVLMDRIPPRTGFEFIPQATDVDAWAETYTHQMWEPLGTADFISDYADDLPSVDVSMREETFNVREFGCSYQFSVKEIEKAAATGKGLNEKKVRAARLASEQKFNRIMWYGDLLAGLFGFINYPNTPRFIIDIPFDASSDSVQVLARMNSIANSVFDITETTAEPDTMLMPPNEYTYVASTPWSENAGDTTILQHFLGNNPFISTVAPARELKDAGPNGNGIIVCYRNAEEVVAHKLVREFTQRSPQDRNLAVITPCHASSGGVASDYPFEWVIAELPAAA